MKWVVHLHDGQSVTIEAERVRTDGGTARFFNSAGRAYNGDGIVAIFASWARIESSDAHLVWHSNHADRSPAPAYIGNTASRIERAQVGST